MSGKVGLKLFAIFILLLLVLFSGKKAYPQAQSDGQIIEQIRQYRERRDRFFEEHPRSPLDESQRRNFEGLRYYPIDLRYRFEGKIERYRFHI
ncbi:MAG: hypothetical protein GTN39_02765 [Candidatus Aenigmarchaeota archaeon]|nr:hypothetical protein [Candidatus Aenigmarchaeota archaeon]